MNSSIEETIYSSTPVKEYPASTSTWSHVIPTNIEALFISQPDLNISESSSDNDSDNEETTSDSEKESSDSGSESEGHQEQLNVSEYFESNDVLETGELDESLENICAVDTLLSKVLLFSVLKLYPSPLCQLTVQEGILQIMNLYLKKQAF